MADKQRWPLADALAVAETLRDTLAPACHRIEIAGSVRRKRADPADIELVCIPKPSDGIFEQDALDAAIQVLFYDGVLDYRLNAKGQRTYGPKNKLLLHVPSGIPVDVFSCSPGAWAMAMMIRTGPSELNVRMMQRFLDMGYKGYIYGVKNRQGEDLELLDEAAVFRLLGWTYQEPWERK